MKRMTRFFIGLTFIGFIPAVTSIHSYADTKKVRGVEQIISEIQGEQKIGKDTRPNPDKVSDRLLEELGESVMDRTIPDKKQHSWMDKMMGYNYLTGNMNIEDMRNYMGNSWNMMGGAPGFMMGRGMYGGQGSGYGMMGDRGSGYGYGMRGYMP